MLRSMIMVLSLLFVVGSSGSNRVAFADESQDSLFAGFQKEAAEYDIRPIQGGDKITLRPQSLLNWTNPARNGENGSVFLWTVGERPAVIGTCFTYTYDGETRYKHALHTLSDQAITAAHRNRSIWTPKKLTEETHEFPGASAVGTTATQRSQQMKLLARKFKVDLTTKQGQTEHCRLVPRPLYRFEADDGQTSGALFAFSVGTDPEALLLLDRRQNSSGKSSWHYSFVRFTFYPLKATLNDTTVWNVPKSENMTSNILIHPTYQTQPYITFRSEWLK